MYLMKGKIPVYIQPVFWFLASFIGVINSLHFANFYNIILSTVIWIVVITLSVLVHEFGHAITSVLFGQKVMIQLVALGGVTERKGGKRLAAWKEFIITLNGPLAGFLLGILAFFAAQFVPESSDVILYTLVITYFVNFFWTILNLLPIQPLDGGKLLSIVLEAFFGATGIKISFFLSFVLASLFTVFFFMVNLWFLAFLFVLLASEGFRLWRESLDLTNKDRDEKLQKLLIKAEKLLKHSRKEEAALLLEQILSKVEKGVIYQIASKHLAKIYYEEGNDQKAYELLSPIKESLEKQDAYLYQTLCFRLEKWEEALEYGSECYRSCPHYELAFRNAIASAKLKKMEPAIGWLELAIEEGMPNPKEALQHHAFDFIRNEKEFKILEEEISS